VLVLKLFYEEPAALEARPADLPDRPDPAALFGARPRYRAYLAGTDLTAGRTGATALPDPAAFARPLAEAIGGAAWTEATADAARPLAAEDVPDRLLTPGPARALASGPAAGRPADPDALIAVARAERPATSPELRALLDVGCAVLLPEPAPHGHDWTVFTPGPLKAPLAEAFARHPVPGLRRFAAPMHRARGEHRFYFERWALDALPDWAEELTAAETPAAEHPLS